MQKKYHNLKNYHYEIMIQARIPVDAKTIREKIDADLHNGG